MRGDLQNAGGLETRNQEPIAIDPIDPRERAMLLDSRSGKTDQASNIDQLVSNFLTELTILSNAQDVAQDQQVQKDPDALPHHEEAAGSRVVDEEILTRDSDIAAWDLESTGTRDKLESSKSNLASSASHESAKTNPAVSAGSDGTGPPRPITSPEHHPPAPRASSEAWQPRAARRNALRTEEMRELSQPEILRVILPSMRRERRRQALRWAIILILILGALAGIYVIMRSKPRQTTATVTPLPDLTATPVVSGALPAAERGSLPTSAPKPVAAKPRQPIGSPPMQRRAAPAPWASGGGLPRSGAPASGVPNSQAGATRPETQAQEQSATALIPAAQSVTTEPSDIVRDPAPATPTSIRLPTETHATPVPAEEKRGDASELIRPTATPSVASGSVTTAEVKPPTGATIVKKVAPVYPLLARRNGVSGTVEFDVVVSDKGTVIGITAVGGPVLLRPAAEQAVKQWLFKPATRAGVDLQSVVRVSVIFAP